MTKKLDELKTQEQTEEDILHNLTELHQQIIKNGQSAKELTDYMKSVIEKHNENK